MVQEEPCCLTACGICLPSEETRKDHESDLEDHIYCLLEEGCAGLGKFELGKPSLPVRPKSDLLVAATLNPRLWWPT
ncbi:hypothetical protein MPTK1_7g06670 [Marchantia polymorpha subsp. ruderalis]|nr:hypothetical protein MARPO_1169s0001 [Marchantia polymorpha]BBN16481.1 hypothetical protein Mp_7g06670 [Marchantia polymorpha subsp. ruderalis]|eukprot:PTQ26528.1 hypothetical protein MARPO_1169s0001 [Marchantia polymorpha]